MKRIILLIGVLVSTITLAQIDDPQPLPSELEIAIDFSENVPVFGTCENACYSSTKIPLNTQTFDVSHGSPSFASGKNSIWMWSYTSGSSIRGEGVFTGFNFEKDKKYCIEADVILSRTGTNEIIDPTATFNFDATTGLSHNPVSGGGGQLLNHSPTQNIFSGNYSGSPSYPFNSLFTIKREFKALSNFSQLWIYPKNPGKPHPQLNMQIVRLIIKEAIPCPCSIKATIEFKTDEDKCRYQFFGNATAGNDTQIQGYLWDFGDGTISTQENPLHSYLKSGTYDVTLTIFRMNKIGDCCTRKFKNKVIVQTDCPQKCELDAGFKVQRRGWFLWQSCDLINTSSSNAYTAVVGYEWYVDGVLVSKDKDLINYKGNGKNACLRVYGMTKNGLCCYDEYCANLRK